MTKHDTKDIIHELKFRIHKHSFAKGALPDPFSICLGNVSIMTIAHTMTILAKFSMLLFFIEWGRWYQTVSYFLRLHQEQK